MDKYDWLKKHPVIHFNEIVRKIGNRNYAKIFVHRLIKAGKLRTIGKGAYSASDNIFAIASNVHFPSYLSFLSASYLYGFTQAIPVRAYVVTEKKHKTAKIMDYEIEFVASRHVWGYHKEKQGEEDIFLADIEKLMIDAFLKPEHMGNFNEMENIFVQSSEPSLEKLKEYMLRLDSGRIYRQVGYMLEKHKGIDIHGWMKFDKNYYSLNPFQRGRKIDKKWRLRV